MSINKVAEDEINSTIVKISKFESTLVIKGRFLSGNEEEERRW